MSFFFFNIQQITQLIRRLFRRYDTIGLFERRLDDLVSIAKHSLVVSDESVTPPRRIIYPTDYFPLSDPKHQKLVEQFVQNLETHLGFQRTEVNLAQLWEEKPPSDSSAASLSLQDYLKKASLVQFVCFTQPRSLNLPVHRRHSGPCAMTITIASTNSGPTIAMLLAASPLWRRPLVSDGMHYFRLP